MHSSSMRRDAGRSWQARKCTQVPGAEIFPQATVKRPHPGGSPWEFAHVRLVIGHQDSGVFPGERLCRHGVGKAAEVCSRGQERLRVDAKCEHTRFVIRLPKVKRMRHETAGAAR